MYILFELTNTDMVFTTKDEAGVTITTDTFPLATYEINPKENFGCCELVVRKITDPIGTWPPAGGSYPRSRIIFKNSATLPFQTSNEGDILL